MTLGNDVYLSFDSEMFSLQSHYTYASMLSRHIFLFTFEKQFPFQISESLCFEINSVRLENTFLSRRSRLEKHWDKRSLFYMAKMYTDGLIRAQKYDRLKKCIVINILDFSGDEHPDYHKVYRLRDEKGRKYSDQFEIQIIELNKELTRDRMDDWIRLFRVENRGELIVLWHMKNFLTIKRNV